MPMVLRSRKAIRAPAADSNSDSDSAQQDGSPEPAPPAAPPPSQRRSRSGRVHGRHSTTAATTFKEEGDESDSDSGQNLDLESHMSARAEEMQDWAAAEEQEMDLKNCSVLLNRLETDDRSARKELDDRDDMRKSGIPKPASRIPTFHKRPELAKKDPPEKTTATTEAAKSKTPEVKERSLPAPTVRSPFLSAETSVSIAEQTPAPKSWSLLPESGMTMMTASPRPALRPDRGSDQPLPDLPRTRTGTEQVQKGEISAEEPQEEEADGEEDGDVGDVGDEENVGDEEKNEQPKVEAITDEQPPWEKEPKILEEAKEDSASSEPESDAHSEEEAPESNVESIPALGEKQADAGEPVPSQTQETPVLLSPAPQSAKRTSRCSLSLCCVLPLLLLLLGGSAQHLWLYGLPRSVAQLSAHLELHWLDGLGLQPTPCTTDCRVVLVESMPVGLYPSAPALRPTITEAWLRLLDRAKHSVDIGAFYVALRGPDSEPTNAQGRKVFQKLKNLESRGVDLRVAVNGPQTSTQDTEELAAAGAEVREVDLTGLTGGIIHTKLWAVDQKHLYVGSANMDWRSLSQVKEVGLSVEDCSCLAQDVSRVFGVYWTIGGANASLPTYWPARLSALSSSQNPLHLKFNGVPARVYLSSAPPQISTRGRTDDLAAILSVIEDAQRFVHISVMDFLPLSQYSKPLRFWPPLDSALRDVACSRGVQVRLLVSCWSHSSSAMFVYLQSLLVLNRPPLNCDIQVRVFTVPSTPEQMKIPFARVNHAKFMVTDRVVYIGTSNWSQNYFTQTAGVGLVVNQTGSAPGPGQETLQTQAEQLFLRDWTSQYSTDLTVDQTDACPL